MYTEFFGLDEKPFALLPDPRFLYLGSSHREALAHLLYGIEEGEGFIEVVGQVGTGKTTLCRTLLDRVGHDVDIAFIFNPSRSELELLLAINREFGLPTAEKSRAELMEELNEFLLKGKAAGRRMILVIDEAQNLSAELLEQVRLLSNLETEREKLLQIVLIGQPELEENLSKTELRQLRQRITVRWNLVPFDRAETEEYVNHRLRVAGRRTGRPLFTPAAFKMLYRASGGIPRLINAIADRSLLTAYGDGRERIDGGSVRSAARELVAAPDIFSRWIFGSVIAGLASVTTLLLIGLAWYAGWIPGSGVVRPDRPPAVAAAATATVSETVSGRPAPLSATAEGSSLNSLGPLLMQRGAEGSAADALAQVLFLWGYSTPIPGAIDPNEMAGIVRDVSPLKLLARRTDLEQIASLNVPVVLELEPEPNAFRYVALQRLDPDGVAVISAADRIFVLPAVDLYPFWSLRAFFLWRNHDSAPTSLSFGESGTAVRWLQARLTELGYMRPGDPSGQYDRITEDAVRTLQSRYGLNASGQLGPESLIALYSALEYGGPKLDERGRQGLTP